MPPRIHCITDFIHHDQASVDLLTQVVSTGVDGVQVRAKHLTDRELWAYVDRVIAAVRPLGATVLVDDRLDVALAAGADGVHLGAEDLPVRAARALAPRGFLVGATCRDAEQALAAARDGADYAGVGPVYPTTTKTGLPEPIGLTPLARTATVLPVIAIAGITADRVPEVLAAGAHGVAVASAVWRSADPPAAARRLVETVRAAA